MKQRLSLLMLLMLVAFIQVTNAQVEVSSDNGVMTEKNLAFTTTELNDLYIKYNISENDLKFAKNELPNYLEGTILNSDQIVIATENGLPPADLPKGIDCKIISHKEMSDIMKEARAKYIEKYGVDPANPKIDIINGNAIPTQEAKNLVGSGKLVLQEANDSVTETPESMTATVSWDPRAINGAFGVAVFPAKDARHAPTEDTEDGTRYGKTPFHYPNFEIYTTGYTYYWNVWDASNIQTPNNSSQALADLWSDTNSYRTADNRLLLGWAHNMDHNGMAYHNGPVSVCADTADGFDWPHRQIVQHEISHNFGAAEGGWFSWEHPECIMNYEWAYLGTTKWCTSCKNAVNYGLFH